METLKIGPEIRRKYMFLLLHCPHQMLLMMAKYYELLIKDQIKQAFSSVKLFCIS